MKKMKKNKKIIPLILACLLAFGACVNSKNSNSATNNNSSLVSHRRSEGC